MATAAGSEHLALAAAVFTAAVDSWIPESWGKRASAQDEAASFEKRLRTAAIAGDDNKLGVGHADIGALKSRAPRLAMLHKRLGKVDRAAGSSKASGRADGGGPSAGNGDGDGDGDDDDHDEAESRAQSIASKRKRASTLPDLLAGKKKNKQKQAEKVHPLLNLAPKATVTSNDGGGGGGSGDDNDNDSSHAHASSATEAKAIPPTSFKKAVHFPPQSPPSKKRPREELPPPSSPTTQPPPQSPRTEPLGESKLSKTQRRRDARKRARLGRNPLG